MASRDGATEIEHVLRYCPFSKTVAFNFSPITQKAVKLGLSIFNTLITVTAWVHICLYVIQVYFEPYLRCYTGTIIYMQFRDITI